MMHVATLFQRFALVLAVAITASGCATNPVTGKQELSLISENQEIAIGAEQYLPSQQSQGGIYAVDQDLTAYVNQVGQRIAAVSDRDLPYEFVVLNNSVPNAWALPGGKIAINRGLLVELNSEAELAAVLGHEVVHAAAKHGANAMQRGMLLQGVLMATALSTADSEYSNYIVGGAQLGAQLLSQRYSREAELEADYYGMQYMKRAGYDPQAAVSLQSTFVRLSEGHEQSWIHGLFSSHPPSPERVAKNQETATALGGGGDMGEQQFLDRMAATLANTEAYGLFDQATAMANEGEYEPALVALNRAIDRFPEEARFYGLRGDIYLARDQYHRATEAFNVALARDADYFEYYLGRGLARSRLGQRLEARQDLERSNQLLPTAIANNALGELSLAAGETQAAKRYFETAMGASGEIGKRAADSFVRLDIPDNPGRYIDTGPIMTSDQRLLAVITNQTPFTISNIQLEFQAVVNGTSVSRARTVNMLTPGQQGNVSSGWQFSETDMVESVRIIVRSVSL